LVETLDYPEGVSSVTAYAGGGFFNVENHGGATPEAVLSSFADTMAGLGVLTLGQSVIVLSPEHMRILGNAGWTRENAQDYLFENARRSRADMETAGKFRERDYARQRDPAVKSSLLHDGYMHRGISPADILIIMGGGDAGGHSSFIPSWSRARSSLMQSKPIGVCIDCD
jgi:hypothetical protein